MHSFKIRLEVITLLKHTDCCHLTAEKIIYNGDCVIRLYLQKIIIQI